MVAVLVPVLAMLLVLVLVLAMLLVLVLVPVPVPAVLEPAVLLLAVPVLRRPPQQPRLPQ